MEMNEYTPGLKRVNMLDLDFNIPGNKYGEPGLLKPVVKPPQFDDMLKYAAILSEGFPSVRVDLVRVADRICFGEMTFYPLAGMSRISPGSFDYFPGSYLNLPSKEFMSIK